jgi:hypothetical protein
MASSASVVDEMRAQIAEKKVPLSLSFACLLTSCAA